MRYLVDENISKPDKFIKEHREFENVKSALGIGSADDLIMSKAKTDDYVIITKDIRLTLRALTKGIKVWYFDDKGIDYKIQAAAF